MVHSYLPIVVHCYLPITNELKRIPWIFSKRTNFLPHYKASDIINFRVGTCREMTDLGFYAMRAVGLPVAIDFIPQWPYRDSGHEFNALIGRNGKSVMFLGSEDNPGVLHKPLTKKGKIYRHIYHQNPNSLALDKTEGEKIPDLFKNPRLLDVTDQYVKTHDVVVRNLNIEDTTVKHVYLNVFNNKNWIPIQWGKIKNGGTTFAKMEGGILYMPSYYSGTKVNYFGNPFILMENGDVQELGNETKNIHASLEVTRIFPLNVDSFNTWNIEGAIFEAANKSDFSDADLLYEINERPLPFENRYKLQSSKGYRYLRLKSTKQLNVAELKFFYRSKVLHGKYSGSSPEWFKDKVYSKAFDDDPLTYFDSAGSEQVASLNVDFGATRKIDEIALLPPMFDDKEHHVTSGSAYQLLYWMDGQWIIHDMQMSSDRKVKFKNVPKHTIYLVKDANNDLKSRIFVIDNGKKIWY